MKRRAFIKGVSASAGLGICLRSRAHPPSLPPIVGSHSSHAFDWEETTITDLRRALETGRETATSLTKKYLDRLILIDRQGPALRSVIELNPDALSLAKALDQQRLPSSSRRPLHGIPVLIKDNIATHDRMTTTAGSLALAGSIPSQDAFVVVKLREAGAIILGKTNLSEWANFRGHRSTSGWSGRGGLTKHPYALDRNPSGSSSGSAVAVAANLAAVAVGTETDGSIISPSAVCGLVGLKPTVGLVSRSGVIPISHSQDTAGPMARTVRDAAILLGVLAGIDPRDPATESSRGKASEDYTQFLDSDGLRGARIGVARQFFHSGPGNSVVESTLETMRRLGAVIIDPIDNPTLWRFGVAEDEVLSYEFKAGLNTYLSQLGPGAPVHTLEEVIQFNNENREAELRYFGQEELVAAQARGPLTEPAYLEALDRCRRLSRNEGIDAVMDEHRLDAIVAPAGGPAAKTDLTYGDREVGGSSSPAAVAGYPNITVPAGSVFGLPVGISFFGRAFSEPTLLKIAFAFEQATKARVAPRFLPSIE